MKQIFRTTWTHIRRSPYQSLAALSIMILTFFIISVFTLLGAGSQAILNFFETRPQVTAFFEDQVTLGEIDLLKAKLAETDKVKEMKYISKEEALAIYREQNRDDPLLLEMVTANILPASLEVSTININYLGEIAEILRQEPGVEEVIFQQDVVEALNKWTTNIRLVGLGLAIAFSLAGLLTILVIIGMKVALRKEEVEIMELIGASKGFIGVPFLLEGIFYGTIGALIAWGVAYLLLLYATPFLIDFLAGIPILPVPIFFMLAVLGGELLLGAIIGTLGSFIAVRRYLK
ncbi:MAG TPA: permease-like cell division protein FtsX [Patescibacteria group bacterium]|nr:permease-like cell division protein FtsX [Patescibacteria group bacterium]